MIVTFRIRVSVDNSVLNSPYVEVVKTLTVSPRIQKIAVIVEGSMSKRLTRLGRQGYFELLFMRRPRPRQFFDQLFFIFNSKVVKHLKFVTNIVFSHTNAAIPSCDSATHLREATFSCVGASSISFSLSKFLK